MIWNIKVVSNDTRQQLKEQNLTEDFTGAVIGAIGYVLPAVGTASSINAVTGIAADLGLVAYEQSNEAKCWPYVNDFPKYYACAYAPLPVDPLVLDLNHDGQISTTSLADSTAFFDLNGDKFAEHTAWIGKEDGILFLDKNGNGRVDDINEVFGGNGKDGITELSEYDENLDGHIDANDSVFANLKLWLDLNGNGYTDEGETVTLSELGITEIGLNRTNYVSEGSDARINGTTTFKQNSEEHLVANMELASDKILTVYNEDVEINPLCAILPLLMGIGNVADSFIAYSLNENLLNTALDMFFDYDKTINDFDTFMKKWTGLDKIHEQYGITRTELNATDKAWMIAAFRGFQDTELLTKLRQEFAQSVAPSTTSTTQNNDNSGNGIFHHFL